MKNLTKRDVDIILKYSKSSLSDIKQRDNEEFKTIAAILDKEHELTIHSLIEGKSTKLKGIIKDLKFKSNRKGVIEFRDQATTRLYEIDPNDTDLVNEGKLLPRLAIDHRGSSAILEKHSLLKSYVISAKLYSLSEIAKIPPAAISKLLNEGISYRALNRKNLRLLTEKQVLTESQANTLEFVIALYQLFGEDLDLTEKVISSEFLKSKAITNLQALCQLSNGEWEVLLRESGHFTPEKIKQKLVEYTKSLGKLLPTPSFYCSIKRSVNVEVVGLIQTIDHELLQNAKYSFMPRSSFANTKLTENIKDQRQRTITQSLQTLINSYPRLNIDKILNDKTLSDTDKYTQIRERLQVWNAFVDNNMEQPLLTLDYSPKLDDKDSDTSKLNFDGVGNDEKPLFVRSLKFYQKMYKICNDVQLSATLIENGLHSAIEISRAQPAYFSKLPGVGPSDIRFIQARSRWLLASASAMAGSILELHNGGRPDLSALNNSASIRSYLKQIDGYESLFGNLDYCQCEHCQSILSPAAYFVDLLSFVETKILESPESVAEGHDLHLKTRRPDLWKLPLTCSNTEEYVPYLTIVNEILENYIAVEEGYDPNNLYDPLDDNLYAQGRVAVENLVYSQLQIRDDSISQPFVLPLEELKTYFKHYETQLDRYQIAKALNADNNALVRTFFDVAQGHIDLIITSKNLAYLRTLFDYDFQVTATGIDPVDVQVFLRVLDISREEFSDLIDSTYISPSPAAGLRIVAEKRDPVNDVQNNVERVHGLSEAHLDKMHRFVRLYKYVAWTIKELDALIAHLQSVGLINGISGDWIDSSGTTQPGTMYHLMLLQELKEKLNINCEELLVLIDEFALVPVSFEKTSLFDKAFNLPQYTSTDGTLPKPTAAFIHPYYRINTPQVSGDVTLQRLLGGLKIDSEELFKLIEYLHNELGLDANNGFLLSIENLTLLSRHTLIGKWLGLSINELFRLISLCDEVSGAYVDNYVEFYKLFEFFENLEKNVKDNILGSESGLDKYDAVINRNFANLDEKSQPGIILKNMRERARTENLFAFANYDLTTITEIDLSLADALKIINDNPHVFVRTTDQLYELAESYNFSALVLSSPLAAHEQKIKDHIARYHISQIFPRFLANALEMTVESVVEILRFSGVDYSNVNLIRELKGSTATSDLLTLISDVMPLALAFRSDAVSPELIRFSHDHRSPILFDYTDPITIERKRLSKLLIYKTFFPTADAKYTAAELTQLLGNFTPAGKFVTSGPNNDLHVIKKIFDKEIVMTEFLKGILSHNALVALQQLQDLDRYASTLSVTIDQLGYAVSNDFAELRNASFALLSGFRQRYQAEEQYTNHIEPFVDELNVRKRDALTDYLTRNTNLEFESPDDLYAHFLIDVQMGGCTRTSRLVAAISSLQLFVHRCMRNLEKDENDDLVAVLDEDAKAEWIYRKNYRVWEANRKVFLYPSNWIEPDLRHNKTPLFKELEEELLQQEINEQNVLDAYAKYMKGFEEVASLEVVGVYKEKELLQNSYTLHIVGVTDTNPVQYYYRKVEKLPDVDHLEWHGWQKIDIEIPVKNASPVVFNGNLYLFWTEIKTQPQNAFDGGTSKFNGYDHNLSLHFIKMRVDGRWSPVQNISLKNVDSGILDPGAEGVILDRLTGDIPAYDTIEHKRAKNGYTLSGSHWEKILPDTIAGGFKGLNIAIAGANWNIWHSIDLYKLNLEPLNVSFDTNTLMSNWAGQEFFTYRDLNPGSISDYALSLRKSEDEVSYHKRELFIDSSRKDAALDHWAVGVPIIDENEVVPSERPNVDIKFTITDVKLPQFVVINGTESGLAALTESGNYLLFEDSTNKYVVERLSTTATEQIARMLFEKGVSGLLDIGHQESLTESYPFAPVASSRVDISLDNKIDYRGCMGVYFREIYFHIPFLLANQLNSQQKYEEAQKWYHFIFDPTANADIQPGDSPEVKDQKRRDRVWRYPEFRNVTVKSLRDILIDPVEIAIHKRHPFNPHAIANVRLNAYQKAIVLKYVDNLLDWGDYLFSQDNSESINEAALLYTLAAAILGERPEELGGCKTGALNPRNYETIKEQAEWRSEFLIELENLAASTLDASGPGYTSSSNESTLDGSETIGTDIIVYSPVFCIPPNDELLKYWTEIENRLDKVRNCMNISGIRRQVPLFAPEIDPELLVRAFAEGLSLDDVLNAMSRSIPPYRFEYLLSLAKNYANTLQQLGGSLLSALEKKDNEELNVVRAVQEKNILTLSKSIHEREIEASQEQINALMERRAVVQYRVDYFRGLITKGENQFESEQRGAQRAAFQFRSRSQIMNMIASMSYLIPQMGAPTAITFGGSQIGSSFSAFAGYYGYMASEKDFAASAAGLEAGFSRREEEWKNQLNLAEKELPQLDKEIMVANLRLQIAEENSRIYQQNATHNDEVLGFYEGKFTSTGLYTYLSKSLQRLYRESYNIGLSVARLAEQAYHFEQDDPNHYIESNYWESGHAGLLAGEKLTVALQNLENQFINVNQRRQEITQSFSLLQIDPDALLDLKLNAECDFEIGEIYYDLFYPGQYKRRIKAVRLTIPCVTGPYTNVSARLSLVESYMRTAHDGDLLRVPNSHTVGIATSSAQNDSGQFELSFRDERYAPFEGAGAISSWNVKLPNNFRQFDYDSISDVIITIQYTAEYDDTLRTRVEDMTGTQQRALKHVLSDSATTLYRLINLKHDFSNQFHVLFHSPIDTEVTLTITANHFPIFFNETNLTVTSVHVVLETVRGQSIQNFEIDINNNRVQETSSTQANRHSLDLTSAFAAGIIGDHALKITNLGALANSDGVLLDKNKLINVYLLIGYRMQ